MSNRHASLVGRPRRTLGVGAALVAAVAVIGLGLQAVGALPAWLDPFGQRVIDHSSAPLLVELRQVRQYRAAAGTFQVLVDVEHDTANVPSVISGERTTLFATGSVDALVDFSNLGAGSVTVSPDRRTVTMSLPAPVLGAAALDPSQSRVVGRERGLVQRLGDAVADNPVDDQALYTEAGRRIGQAARQSDLSSRAEQSTRTMLTGLADSLGFDRVVVSFTEPTTG